MKAFIILVIALLCGNAIYSQAIIKGKISDQQTGDPLTGATIKAGNSIAITSSKGDFEMLLPANVDVITVSFIGYETQFIKISSDTKTLHIAMTNSNINLSTVTVTGYESNRKLLETAGSIAVLRSKEIGRGDNMDIMPAINTIPGVKMEAYSAGNYRISIRGSLLNNPWGVRNVRVYWNDIPFSSPDGTAQKSIDFDPALIGSMEVLKGPSGSMYGAGNGGVLLIKNTKADFAQHSAEIGYTTGSYGFSRLQASYKTSGENFNVAANVVRQRYAGYRENNWGDEDIINVFSQFNPTEKRTLNFVITHATGSLGIAGGLNKSQADSMPTQALLYNKNNKISVKKYDATVLGVSQTYHFSDLFSNTTSVYGNFQTYDHPFGSSIYYNGYFKESLSGYGARTKFSFSPTWGVIKSRFNIGAEYQYQHQFENTFTIINDHPGTWPEAGPLYQNDIIKSKSTILFAQAEVDLPLKIFLTAGASYTRLSYDILDLFKGSGHVDYSGILRFPVKISPRVGLVKVVNNHIAVHASMSKGYSPPPVWEINNYDGTLNTDIKPEDGTNYEAGIRGNILKSKLNMDITAYRMRLKNAIVPVARPNGTTAYKNAGTTNQQGLEAMISFIAINNAEKNFSFLKTWLSYTYNHYRFNNYKTQSFDWNSSSVITIDNSGKRVTGVVPNSIAAGVDLDTKYGLYFTTTGYYYDKIPLNDANTYYSDGYFLLNAKLGFKTNFTRFGFDVFTGVNNATDTHYSSLLLYNADANGIPPQFYNPSAGINYYGGVKIKYSFK